MNKKNIFLIVGTIVLIFGNVLLSLVFHQEAPKNTIRILIHQPLDENHFRISPLIQSGQYAYHKNGENFSLTPLDPASPILQFRLVRDENTRALVFLKGEADVIYNALSLSKTEWLRQKQSGSPLIIIESRGNSTSYLAINKDRITSPQMVHNIATALPIHEWIKTVYLNWVEATPMPVKKLNPEQNPNTPLVLDYLTTGSREGLQLAQLVREALRKIGVTVKIHTYESSLYYAKIRKKEFDLFSSRSIPGSKSILDTPNVELIPLFTWKNGLILSPRIRASSVDASTLDETFRFLKDLRLQ